MASMRSCLAQCALLLFSMTRILATADADELKQIDLPGDRAYPESIASSKDGTLFVSSLASGGIWRIKPGSVVAEQWIKPGAYETGATFGVLVDQKSNLLWVCSNDLSVLGLSPLNQVKGSFVKGFDLSTGEGKVSVPLPQSPAICNYLALGPDGNLSDNQSPEAAEAGALISTPF